MSVNQKMNEHIIGSGISGSKVLFISDKSGIISIEQFNLEKK